MINEFNEWPYFLVQCILEGKSIDVAAHLYNTINKTIWFLALVAFAIQNYKHANDFFLYLISATALRYQEELMRLRLQKRQQEARKISLVNAVRILQHRGSQSRSRLSIMMTNNLKKEKETTEEIEKV